jgi:hypothetical protein
MRRVTSTQNNGMSLKNSSQKDLTPVVTTSLFQEVMSQETLWPTSHFLRERDLVEEWPMPK